MIKLKLQVLEARLGSIAEIRKHAWGIYDDLTNRRSDAQGYYFGMLRNDLDAKDAQERYEAISKAAHSAFECYREVNELFIAAQDELIAAMEVYERDFPGVVPSWDDDTETDDSDPYGEDDGEFVFDSELHADFEQRLADRAETPDFPTPTRKPGDIPF